MRRRIGIFLLATLFVVGVFVRILHFPFREESVLRVISAGALAMGRHVEPSERLMDMLASGFLDPVMTAAGFPGDTPGLEMLEDPGFVWLVRQLGQRYVAWSYVAHFGRFGQPAFVCSAWVGGRLTHLARLGFLDDAFPGFRVIQQENGTRIWRRSLENTPRGFEHFSFGVYEGVAFGVVTGDPVGAAQLYQVMRRQAKSGARRLLEAQSEVIPASLADRCYFRVAPDVSIHAGLRFDRDAGLEIMVTGLLGGHGLQVGETLPAAVGNILALLQPTMAIHVSTTIPRGIRLLRLFPVSSKYITLAELLYTHLSGRKADAGLVGWVSNWNDGGRINRLKVPAVGLAFEALSGASAEDLLSVIFSRLESLYGIDWAYSEYGARGVYALGPRDTSWYGRLSAGERFGFTIWNGFAVLHSSAEALDQLLADEHERLAQDVFVLPPDVGWSADVDLESAAEVLRMGAAAYSLWQSMQGQQRDRQQEAWLGQGAELVSAYDRLMVRAQELPGQRFLSVIQLQRPDAKLRIR